MSRFGTGKRLEVGGWRVDHYRKQGEGSVPGDTACPTEEVNLSQPSKVNLRVIGFKLGQRVGKKLKMQLILRGQGIKVKSKLMENELKDGKSLWTLRAV